MLSDTLTLAQLHKVMSSYSPISDITWEMFQLFCQVKQASAGDVIYPTGKIPTSFSFIYQGLMRGFSIDEKGHEYNKIFFSEDMFPGSMTALLTNSPAKLGIEAIEPTTYITINFANFRQLLQQNNELMLFQIHYLEKNWLLAKDAREIALVQQDASQRYLAFINEYPSLSRRLPQYHIASHLGITPTQLSRIKKTLPQNQHM